MVRFTDKSLGWVDKANGVRRSVKNEKENKSIFVIWKSNAYISHLLKFEHLQKSEYLKVDYQLIRL